jgi:ribosomal protein S21
MIMDPCVVEVVDGNVAATLKALKKGVESAGIQRDLRRHEHYTKRSAARNLKSRVARARARKSECRQRIVRPC